MITSGNRITWFLPEPWVWTDPTGRVWHDAVAQADNEGPYASGMTLDDTLGIALPNRSGTLGKWTLGGWWKVTFPDLKVTATIRQVDIGPDTGVIDLNAPLAYAMVGSPGALVDRSQWTASYLGSSLPDGETEGVVKEG